MARSISSDGTRMTSAQALFLWVEVTAAGGVDLVSAKVNMPEGFPFDAGRAIPLSSLDAEVSSFVREQSDILRPETESRISVVEMCSSEEGQVKRGA